MDYTINSWLFWEMIISCLIIGGIISGILRKFKENETKKQF